MKRYYVSCVSSADFEIDANSREEASEIALEMFNADSLDVDIEVNEFEVNSDDCPYCKNGCCTLEDAEIECEDYYECECCF